MSDDQDKILGTVISTVESGAKALWDTVTGFFEGLATEQKQQRDEFQKRIEDMALALKNLFDQTRARKQSLETTIHETCQTLEAMKTRLDQGQQTIANGMTQVEQGVAALHTKMEQTKHSLSQSINEAQQEMQDLKKAADDVVEHAEKGVALLQAELQEAQQIVREEIGKIEASLSASADNLGGRLMQALDEAVGDPMQEFITEMEKELHDGMRKELRQETDELEETMRDFGDKVYQLARDLDNATRELEPAIKELDEVVKPLERSLESARETVGKMNVDWR
ncbi:MAG: hypothetical protein ACR2IE_17855 [Candidatus Sumerlaeaceae bacterium]